MPYHDGTGPFGDGRPGRGLGPCGRFGAPVGGGFGRGYGRRLGRGFGGGYGRGFGCRNYGYYRDIPGYYNPEAKQDIYPYTREDLEAQKDELEKQIKWVNERIAETEK